MDSKTKIFISAVVALIIIVGIALWQMQPSLPKYTNGYWVKPLAWNYYSETNILNATFINGEGSAIKIIGVKVSGDCTTGSFEKTEVAAGHETQFSCTGTRKNRGDIFSIDVDITYTKTIGNSTTTHKSRGTLRGIVE